MLAADGLDADGLKVDFTARTPAGRALTDARRGVGDRAAARAARDRVPRREGGEGDALVVTHTPHPAFADVTDMIRLNDVLQMDGGVVELMRHRAAVARAAVPEL